MKKNNVLLVCYQFPPLGGVGVQRALSLARYLPTLGYKVHVLTPKNAASHTYDNTLVERVPAEVTVHRSFSPEVSFELRNRIWRWISRSRGDKVSPKSPVASKRKSMLAKIVERLIFPDPQVVWFPNAVLTATNIIRRFDITTVIVTAPPFSLFMTGNALKRRFPHITLISDFRDEWINYYLAKLSGNEDQSVAVRAARIECETVRLSDRIVAVTSHSLSRLKSSVPDQSSDKFAMIPNGFDAADFRNFVSRPQQSKRIVVTYVGTVYDPCSPVAYLNALDRLPEDLRSRFETRFIGRVADSQRAVLANRHSLVTVLGFVNHAAAIRAMEEADYLLLTLTEPAPVPGKLFEYLATGKPILAIVPPLSECAEIIRRAGAGRIVDHRNNVAIEAELCRLLEGSWEEFGPKWDEIRRYERSRLAALFAALIDGRSFSTSEVQIGSGASNTVEARIANTV